MWTPRYRCSDGHMRCQEIQQAFRNCPGERSVEVYRSDKTTDSDVGDEGSTFLDSPETKLDSEVSPRFPSNHTQPDLGGIEGMDSMFRMLDEVMGGSIFGRFPGGGVFGGSRRNESGGRPDFGNDNTWSTGPTPDVPTAPPHHRRQRQNDERTYREYDHRSESV